MKARILRNPKIMVGKPTIAGTRITVELILNLIEHGQTIPQIADEYDLREDQVRAAIKYAKDKIINNFVVITEKEGKFKARIASGQVMI